MKIISLLAQKGGVGKTTLAVNLAICAMENGKRKVAIIDLDEPQYSACDWEEWRPKDRLRPSLFQGSISVLDKIIAVCQERGMEYVVIDTPGRQSALTKHVAKHSDLCIVPCQTSFSDVKANQATFKVLESTKTPSFAILTRCQPNLNGIPHPLTKDAEDSVGKLKFPLAKTRIHNRIAYIKAQDASLGVIELFPRSDATREIKQLWKEIKATIQ